MKKAIDFYFDVGSPATYLAWTQLPGIAQKHDAAINWKPMLLGGVFKSTGNQSPVTVAAKGRYTLVDLMRFANEYGVPFAFNPHFPINTLHLMRGAAGLLDSPRFHDYLKCVFTALWVDAQDLNDPSVVSAVLDKAGFDPAEILTNCESPDAKSKLKQITEEAVDRGVFGAPTFFVGEDMFFGQDRLNWMQRALQSAD